MFSGLGATAQASVSFNAGGSGGTSSTPTPLMSAAALQVFQQAQKAVSDVQRRAAIEASRRASSEAASRAGAIAAQLEREAKAKMGASTITKQYTAQTSGGIPVLAIVGAAVVAAGVVGYLVLRK